MTPKYFRDLFAREKGYSDWEDMCGQIDSVELNDELLDKLMENYYHEKLEDFRDFR